MISKNSLYKKTSRVLFPYKQKELLGNFGSNISASASALASALQKFYFCFKYFLEKIEHLCSSFLCLSLASIPLCYKYLFLCDLLFIHPKGAHWYSKHPSIGVSKNNCSGNVCKIPSKTFSVESFFSPFADLPGRF